MEEVGLNFGATFALDLAVEFGAVAKILCEYFLDFIAGVVIKLYCADGTILVKELNLIPLSLSSLKKLKRSYTFCQYGALAVRAE